jgi:hypothetical protein
MAELSTTDTTADPCCAPERQVTAASRASRPTVSPVRTVVLIRLVRVPLDRKVLPQPSLCLQQPLRTSDRSGRSSALVGSRT